MSKKPKKFKQWKMPKFINVNGTIYKRMSKSELGEAVKKHRDKIVGGERTFAKICSNQSIFHGDNMAFQKEAARTIASVAFQKEATNTSDVENLEQEGGE